MMDEPKNENGGMGITSVDLQESTKSKGHARTRVNIYSCMHTIQDSELKIKLCAATGNCRRSQHSRPIRPRVCLVWKDHVRRTFRPLPQ